MTVPGRRARITLRAALLLAVAQAASAGSFRAGVGYDYTTGTYGGPQTITETYVPVTAAYRSDQWEVRLTVPYVSVSGPATIIDSSGQFAPGPGGTHGGLGDVILGGTLYDLVRSDTHQFYLDLSGQVKFGTADSAQGLGTGETDYSAQFDALKELGRFGLFGTAGYVVRGSPGVVNLRNVPYFTVGSDYRVGRFARAGFTYSYSPAAISGDPALQEATFFVAFAARHGFSIRPYILAGFSDTSPGWGAGISVAWDGGSEDWSEPEWIEPDWSQP